MIDPKMRHATKGTPTPRRNIHHVSIPIATVESSTPRVHSIPIVHLFFEQPFEVDVQSPGKEQEAEHAVHQGLVETNFPKKAANAHRQTQA